MERRWIVFIVLSGAVIVLWSLLFPPPRPVAVSPSPSASGAPVASASASPTPTPTPTGDTPQASPSPTPVLAPKPPRPVAGVRDDIVLKSDRLRATLTNRGAGITSLEAIYPTAKDAVKLLAIDAASSPHFALADHSASADPIDVEPWSIVSVDETTAVFSTTLTNGLAIEKKFKLEQGRDAFTLSIRITNPRADKVEQSAYLDLHALRGLLPDGDYRAEQYQAGFYGRKESAPVPVALASVHKAAEEHFDPDREWFGLRNRYFAVAMIPADDATRLWIRGPRFHALTPREQELFGHPAMNLSLPANDAPVATERAYAFTVFAGPLRDDALRAVSQRFGLLVSWGGGCFLFSWIVPLIVPVLLGLMNGIHAVVGNFGVAIVLTTIIVKLCLFPMTRKSQISMAKFAEVQKKLKPKMDILQQRYADNPNKLRTEQMALFKEHGTSMVPLAGCLPMLLQMPFWIGMYTVFDQSIDLRNQAFFGWIHDLSRPDALAKVGSPFSMLIFQYDGHINLLPILMMIMWFTQAYLQPRPADPQMAQQQKMMMFMPVLFGLMMYTLASGLSLYFLTNSLLSLVEQKVIKKFWISKIVTEPTAAAGA